MRKKNILSPQTDDNSNSKCTFKLSYLTMYSRYSKVKPRALESGKFPS